MFDLPDAKRVRRSDLYTRSHSESPTPSELDPELEAELRARLASICGPLSALDPIPDPATYDEAAHIAIEDGASENPEEQEFEFRLFATPGVGSSAHREDAAAQRIILAKEDEDDGDGGFVIRERNRGYYFAEKSSGERKLRFKIMALSGEDVLSSARKRSWGLEVPWRVRVLKVAGWKGAGGLRSEVIEEGKGDGKRKRPGKKRRIISRQRQKSRDNLQEQQRVEKEKKDDAEREKRTRRNREKKLKKKMKEKASKAGNFMDEAGSGAAKLEEPSNVDMATDE